MFDGTRMSHITILITQNQYRSSIKARLCTRFNLLLFFFNKDNTNYFTLL